MNIVLNIQIKKAAPTTFDRILSLQMIKAIIFKLKRKLYHTHII